MGLDSMQNYEPSITIGETGQEFNFEYDHDSVIVLKQLEWFKLISLTEQVETFFRKELADSQQPQMITLEDEANPIVSQETPIPLLELEKYFVEFNTRQKVLRFNMKAYIARNIPCLDITLTVWKDLLCCCENIFKSYNQSIFLLFSVLECTIVTRRLARSKNASIAGALV